MYTVQQLKERLESKLHGASLDDVNDPNGAIEEAVRNVVNKTDFYESKKFARLYVQSLGTANAVILPSDLKTTSIISSRNLRENYQVPGRYVSMTDVLKGFVNFEHAIDLSHGLKLLYVNANRGELSQVIDNFGDADVWTASGSVTSATLSTSENITDSSALILDMDSSGVTGAITATAHDDIDFSDYVNPILFLWASLPSTNIASITLKIGSDSSNYYEVSATTQHTGEAFAVGPNILKFDLSSATETGTPTDNTDYIQVTVTSTNATKQRVIIDSLQITEQTEHSLPYYSRYLVKDATTGAWKGTVDDDEDIIVLSEDSINILIYETASLLAPEIFSSDSGFDEAYYTKKRDEARREYVNQYPSEKQKKMHFYYPPDTRHGRRRFYRRY